MSGGSIPTGNSSPSGRSILIVQTAFLGDLLLGIPFYKQVRQIWPQHEIILLCKKGLSDFFLKTKMVDKAIEVIKGDRISYARAS